MGEKQTVRFSVLSEDGAFRSSSWKLWGKTSGDVYLSCREIGHAMHISFHWTGQWHVCYDQEFLNENAPSDSELRNNRFTSSWEEPAESVEGSGIRLMYQIVVPGTAATRPISQKERSKITLIPAPPESKCREIALISTEAHTKVTDWPAKRSMSTELVGDFQLESERRIWVVQRVVDMPQPGSVRGTPTFFGNATREDLKGDGLRALRFGQKEDGGRFVIEGVCEATQ